MSVAAVGGAVAGGLIASSGAKSAANAQAGAAGAANALTEQQYNQTRSDNRPFLQAGTSANNQLAALLGLSQKPLSPDEVEKMLIGQGYGYVTGKSGKQYFVKSKLNQAVDAYLQQQAQQQEIQNAAQSSGTFGSLMDRFSEDDLGKDVPFQLGHEYAQKQGNTGVNRIAAASGNQLSGATLKALERSGANIANQYAGDAYNRFTNDQTNTYNRLAGISGAGQQAANQVSSAGQNYASQVGNNLIGSANARGASAIAQGNALSGAIGNIANNYQQQNFLNSLSNLNSNPYNVNGAASGQF